jgi:cytidine deaminase
MEFPLQHPSRDTLLQAASDAALRAYAPYSNFRVGAALWTGENIVTGCNVENASYGLCLCAERAALAAAVSAGSKKIHAMAVACIDAKPELGLRGRMPCGACRQWLLELAPDAEIHIAGSPQVFRVQQLLPDGFTLS